ncbi:amidase [Priestia aryabhattai]|uniref:amidase n=1 Tax=Priestia aryabhattai TaxID=412384 RepID=UPI002E1E591C|nr:amidase [Priestia aryabhattai]
MHSDSILNMDITTLSLKIKNKEISPVEITECLLNRIKDINPALNAFITINEEAVKQAKIAEKEIMNNEYKGALHGIPIGVKDLVYTRNMKTTMGSKIYQHFTPDYDATVVEKLHHAGAITIGKLNTHEFAYGPSGDVSYYGAVKNPHDTKRISGGSSSGSGAAVSAGLCYGAIGTDTGGSIRIPSSACGIVGMKPTFGRVSKHGVFPLGETLDHVGPMTRTVSDNALFLETIAGYDTKDLYSVNKPTEHFSRFIGSSILKKTIGIPSNFYFDALDSEVGNALKEAVKCLEELGASVKSIELPMLSQASWAQSKTIQSEAYMVHEKRMKAYRQDYQLPVLERLEESQKITGYEYAKAQQIRLQAQKEFQHVFESVDVLIAPTLPILPPYMGEEKVRVDNQMKLVRSELLRLTEPSNLLGLPTLSLPCGYSRDGLPIGMQLIGPHFAEAALYQIGYAFEQHRHIPTLKWNIQTQPTLS